MSQSLPIANTLSEASPTSISDLFSRDVEGLSDSDIDMIISHLRANRERMALAEAAGKSIKPIRSLRPKFEPGRVYEDEELF